MPFPQSCITEAIKAGGPRFGMLEVKALTGELDMKETVMETLLSHLEVCSKGTSIPELPLQTADPSRVRPCLQRCTA